MFTITVLTAITIAALVLAAVLVVRIYWLIEDNEELRQDLEDAEHLNASYRTALDYSSSRVVGALRSREAFLVASNAQRDTIRVLNERIKNMRTTIGVLQRNQAQ